MTASYAPGTVAMVKYRGETVRAFYGLTGWVTINGAMPLKRAVTDIRPLIVLDPDEFALPLSPEWLRWAAFDLEDSDGYRSSRAIQIDELADAIEARLPKPKPAEPTGLGAVVIDSGGNKWIRRGPTHYIAAEGSSSGFYNNAQTWAELDVVDVLSEGVQP